MGTKSQVKTNDKIPTADTSITVAKAEAFSRAAAERDRLSCTKNTGFFLIKLKAAVKWRFRYTDLTGKRREITIGSYPTQAPREAAYIAQNMSVSLRNGIDPLATKEKARLEAKKAESQTVKAFLDGFYTKHQNRKKDGGKHTLKIIESNFKSLMQRPMASLTEQDIHEWQIIREKDGKARSTIVRAYGALKTMLKMAHQKGYTDRMPLDGVQLMKAPAQDEDAPKEDEKRRMLTTEEISALLRAVNDYNEDKRQQRENSRAKGKLHLADLSSVAYCHWFVPFFHCALHLGMRPGDLYTLDWSHVNLTFHRLVKTLEKTKHHNEPTVLDIPLNDQVLEVLNNWHEQKGKPKEGLVFPSPVNGKQMDKLAHRKSWVHVKKKAGEAIPEKLQFYSLRHHFISALVSANVPLLAVAKLAGHKGTKMIEQHYGHLAASDAINAMRALGESLTPKTPPNKTNIA
ncbi:hypothetical protein A3743_16290 [Oleiphilus sp. HI0072]|nr:hypothetical protein A3743_16290 [Oleiphilus sp. HI0072]